MYFIITVVSNHIKIRRLIMNEEKRKALESAFGQIEKEFGSGAVYAPW